VFPGGVLDEADYSIEWLDLFPKEAQHSMEETLVKKSPSERLSLYSGVPSDCIIGELAFRICAIREAFEETGILLARPIDSISQLLLGGQAPCYQLLKSIGEEWRKRVCDDARNFVQLFRLVLQQISAIQNTPRIFISSFTAVDFSTSIQYKILTDLTIIFDQ